MAIFLATGLAFIFEYKAEKEFAVLNRINDDEPVQCSATAPCVRFRGAMWLWAT